MIYLESMFFVCILCCTQEYSKAHNISNINLEIEHSHGYIMLLSTKFNLA